jgi:hypothetical protein
VDGVPLNISALASTGRLVLSFTNRVIFPLVRRVAMRLRTLVNRLFWLGLAASFHWIEQPMLRIKRRFTP